MGLRAARSHVTVDPHHPRAASFRVTPQEAWKPAVAALHRHIAGSDGVVARVRFLAHALVGRPYRDQPLEGGPHRPECLVVRLDAFDCVTLVESVLALARSRSQRGFLRELRLTRYRHGRVRWQDRLHYFSDWMRTNQRRGAVRIRTRGAGARWVETRLAALAGLPARNTRFQVVPKHRLHLARRRLTDGAIAAFASVRAALDFFHTGLLLVDDPRARPPAGITLIHAARRSRRVVAEPLGDFLRRNRMRGLAWVTPLPAGGDR